MLREVRLARKKIPAMERQHRKRNTATAMLMMINTFLVDGFIIFLVFKKVHLYYKVYLADGKCVASECRK